MGIRLENALLVDIDPPLAEPGALRIVDGCIAERGASVTLDAGDERIDCAGCVVLPGLVNGHTHLYSALAVGMPPPPRAPRNFEEILGFVWWRLDRALDAGSIRCSAEIGALDALHCGTTTLIDHHASPNAITGSLDEVQRGIACVGLRGVLCYETTDRNGREGRDTGLAENRRYAESCRRRADGRFAGLIGAHASFTLEDESLDRLSDLARDLNLGVHIHVAEDPCDERDALERSGQKPPHTGEVDPERGLALIERLEHHGLLNTNALVAHGTHLGDAALARLGAARVTLAHNARSNLNNGVGYAPIARATNPVILGTDGIGGDMFAETRAAWFAARDHHAGLLPQDIIAMLATAARRASAALGVELGKLQRGAAADIVITDYRPATPLTAENVAGHLLFGLAARHVRHVLVGGAWALRDRITRPCDETAIRQSAFDVAEALWSRMSALR